MPNFCVWIDWLKAGELPEAPIVDGVLKIIPPDDQELEELEQLTRQAYAMLPRIKITDLLVEVDEWTSFAMRWLGRCSLTGWVNCATAPTKTNSIGQAV
jgi:hypothetical protein